MVEGMILGGMIKYIFGGMEMKDVGREGGEVVKEVRRKLSEKKGIMKGKERKDYEREVDIMKKEEIREMIIN